jgi:rod shape-determining protein MreD
MKYRVIASILIIWIAAFFQSTVLECIEIFNVRPNLLIVVTVIIALLRNSFESAVMGLSLGLTMDILMSKTMGWYALLFFLLTIPITLVNEKIYKEKFLVLFFFAFVSTVFVETMFFLILFMFDSYSYLPYVFSRVIVPEAFYNSVLIFLLFKPLSKLYTILNTLDRRRNRITS